MRRKLLEAHDAGAGSLPELAELFGVSVGWAKYISATRLHTGQMERPMGGKRGRRSSVTEAARQYLSEQVKQQPDRTLVLLQQDLKREYSIQIGITQVWNILKGMGWRFKKSHSRPPNSSGNKSPQKESFGRKQAKRSIRSASFSSTKAGSQRK